MKKRVLSDQFHWSYPGLSYIPPYVLTIVSGVSGIGFVMILTTPPSAFDPYRAELAPLTTSIRSTCPIGTDSKFNSPVSPARNGIPSRSISTRLPAPRLYPLDPRMFTCVPVMFTPGM